LQPCFLEDGHQAVVTPPLPTADSQRQGKDHVVPFPLMIPILAPTPENLQRAAEALRRGELVGMPTETVYGLAGNARDPAALARIFEVKRRPFFDPLIVHVAERAELEDLCEVTPEAEILMRAFWPGPLTLVLAKKGSVPDLATSGLPSVAVRMPAHPVARALMQVSGLALAAPSANPFGGLSPTRAEHVAAAFETGIDCVLDGGPCAVGVESSVVGWEHGEPRLLRAGGVSLEALQQALGKTIRPAESTPGAAETAQAAPGALPWHYAPRTPLRLLDSGITPKNTAVAGLLCFGENGSAAQDAMRYARIENLSTAGNLAEAAANLFAALHRLDAAGMEVLHAALVPESGLGRAINDRLRKAAAAPGKRD
jgi:L-threonylcarbamoyladenylate synthase